MTNCSFSYKKLSVIVIKKIQFLEAKILEKKKIFFLMCEIHLSTNIRS